jgi:hypothetical protein
LAKPAAELGNRIDRHRRTVWGAISPCQGAAFSQKPAAMAPFHPNVAGALVALASPGDAAPRGARRAGTRHAATLGTGRSAYF